MGEGFPGQVQSFAETSYVRDFPISAWAALHGNQSLQCSRAGHNVSLTGAQKQSQPLLLSERLPWVEAATSMIALAHMLREVRVRDRASYINQARGILRQSLYVLGFNGLLLILLGASGAIAGPRAHGSLIMLMIGLGSALMIPIAKVGPDARRKCARDYGLYLGLVGTTLLWGPLYLEAAFGPQPGFVSNFIYVGVALLVGSIFWPVRTTCE